jgi:hypothetical protein
MKHHVLSALILVTVAAPVSPSFAQGDGFASVQMSRMPQATSGEANRLVARNTAPVLEGDRRPAAMLPETPGPVRDAAGISSNAPVAGDDLRPGLRRP